jgi:rare lipoprotein A
MPIAPTSCDSQRGKFASKFSLSVPASFRVIAGTVVFCATLACSGCDRSSPQTKKEKPNHPVDTQPSPSAKKDKQKKPYSGEGYAVWYSVPLNSLANRRAGKDEFTAAHNHLPLGTTVRVTHLANGKSVIVRITDRGITKRGASIDLCKPAAEKLGMISEGMARVRIEELPDDAVTDTPPDSKTTAAHP